MRKLLILLAFCSTFAFSQQSVEVNYEVINREFQKQLQQLLQSFTDNQSAQGNSVVVGFYDNNGEVRVSASSSSAPSYLKTITDYKVKFMRDRQLTSTKGVSCEGPPVAYNGT